MLISEGLAGSVGSFGLPLEKEATMRKRSAAAATLVVVVFGAAVLHASSPTDGLRWERTPDVEVCQN